VKGRGGRRRPPFLLRQVPADLRQERAVVDKAQRGVALVDHVLVRLEIATVRTRTEHPARR